MIFPKLSKLNFTISFFEKNLVLPFYKKVYNKTNGQNFLNKNLNVESYSENYIYIVNGIPPYFELKLDEENKPFKKFNVYPRLGFLASLEKYDNVRDYMNDQFKSKSRSRIRSCIRRLELCYNIEYKTYFGAITKDEYNFLFSKFKSMIERRFNQRTDSHAQLKNWDFYEKTTYPMILEKKASLFVIYNNGTPIDICLSYHHQNIVNNVIRSYDVDYSKFKLGYVDILKQLEWCFENNYKIFDLGWGEMDYKYQWCNVVHKYECHVVYNNNNLSEKILAYVIAKLIIFKTFLRRKKIIPITIRLKTFFKKPSKNLDKKQKGEPVFTIKDLSKMPPIDKSLSIVNIDKEEFAFLRAPTYNFQYLNSESSGNIKVYKIITQKDSFIIEGKNKAQKISKHKESEVLGNS